MHSLDVFPTPIQKLINLFNHCNLKNPHDDPCNFSSCLTLSCNNSSIKNFEKALKGINPKIYKGPDRIHAFLVHLS